MLLVSQSCGSTGVARGAMGARAPPRRDQKNLGLNLEGQVVSADPYGE